MLRVDYTYPQAKPRPIALEISGLVNRRLAEGMQARWKLGEDLSQVARVEGLGCWTITVEFTGRNEALSKELLALMRAGIPVQTRKEPGSGDTHPLYNPQLRERLIRLGIRSVEPVTDGRYMEPCVELIGADTVQPKGFRPELDRLIEDNAEKLAEARPRSTHLAVPVVDWRVSDDPSLTPPPQLPPAIDVLWVIRSINGILHGWVTSSFHTQGDPAWHEITQGDFESTND